MRPQDVHAFRRAVPFRAFRIFMADGRTFDVHQAALVMVGRETIIVGIPRPGDTRAVFDRTVILDLSAIDSIKPLESITFP